MTSTTNKDKSSNNVVKYTKDISLEQQEEEKKERFMYCQERNKPMIVVFILLF